MAYNPTRERDHVQKGLAKFLEQFKGKPVLASVLGSWLAQIQKLEDAIWEVILIRGIELSEGIGLDHIGNIVGRKRLGLEDPDYRVALRAQIRINRSSGTPEDVIAVTELSLPPEGFSFEYEEEYPATVLIQVNEQVSFLITVLFDNLVRAKDGGVRLFLLYIAHEQGNSFRFASSAESESDPAQGFGNVLDPSTGGKFVSMLAT